MTLKLTSWIPIFSFQKKKKKLHSKRVTLSSYTLSRKKFNSWGFWEHLGTQLLYEHAEWIKGRSLTEGIFDLRLWIMALQIFQCLYREAIRLQRLTPTRYVRGVATRTRERYDHYQVCSKTQYWCLFVLCGHCISLPTQFVASPTIFFFLVCGSFKTPQIRFFILFSVF